MCWFVWMCARAIRPQKRALGSQGSPEPLDTEAGNRTWVLEVRSPARAGTFNLSHLFSAPGFSLLDRFSISNPGCFRKWRPENHKPPHLPCILQLQNRNINIVALWYRSVSNWDSLDQWYCLKSVISNIEVIFMFSITVHLTHRVVNHYTQGEIVTQSHLKSPLVLAFSVTICMTLEKLCHHSVPWNLFICKRRHIQSPVPKVVLRIICAIAHLNVAYK